MNYLALRTDTGEACLSILRDETVADELRWQADRRLSDELLGKIATLLHKNGLQNEDLAGVIVFAGPGSFTGLRIGHAVANALASSLGVPVASCSGEDWRQEGARSIAGGSNPPVAIPEYGSEANVTKPRK